MTASGGRRRQSAARPSTPPRGAGGGTNASSGAVAAPGSGARRRDGSPPPLAVTGLVAAGLLLAGLLATGLVGGEPVVRGLLGVLGGSPSASALAQASPAPVDYRLSFPAPAQRWLAAEVRFDDVGPARSTCA